MTVSVEHSFVTATAFILARRGGERDLDRALAGGFGRGVSILARHSAPRVPDARLRLHARPGQGGLRRIGHGYTYYRTFNSRAG